jgi:hypothetical protein
LSWSQVSRKRTQKALARILRLLFSTTVSSALLHASNYFQNFAGMVYLHTPVCLDSAYVLALATVCRVARMLDAFSYNREYDYIRLEGLYRATGRPAHEWDIYIVKELIDNALDADEILWYSEPAQFPSLSIHMEYISMPPPQCQQLLISVSNRAPFPVQHIQNIFSTRWYTSHKAFVKKMTRGALGNALKTLLGIPYALHNRSADDWQPNLKPLSICSGATEYLPRYIIDSTAQTIHLECDSRPCKPIIGTLMSVGLDYFVQQMPRTITEIERLAQHYHLCNPHAEFHWTVEMHGQKWEQVYLPQTGWSQKFRQVAPIQWYSLTEFKNLLGAFYRERYHEDKNGTLSLQAICSHFSGFQSTPSRNQTSPTIHVLREIGRESLAIQDIESPLAKNLYAAIGKYSLPVRPAMLGFLGSEYVSAQLRRYFPVSSNVHYLQASETEVDPSTPFVLEVAAAYLQTGKRQLWTAMNFSPTYGDPFLSCWLSSPMQPTELVLGLRGLLDTYSMREDTPFVLFLHLICPTIEHNEFSKTEINHLPFKKVLGQAIDTVLRALQQGQEEEEMHLEQAVFQALNAILHSLTEGEKFVPEQLLETVRLQLGRDLHLVHWLERPDVLDRLRSYIATYQVRYPEIRTYIARQADVLLYLPSHPRHYFSIPIDHLSQNLLERHCVNKILYIQERELEPVVIANNWLCQMDMALLQLPSSAALEETLLFCATESDLPLLVLHNGDASGYLLMEQIAGWLKRQHINQHRIVDLQPDKGNSASISPTKRMPHELGAWLFSRLAARGITLKYVPAEGQLRRDIRTRFDQHLHEYIVNTMEHHFSLAQLMIALEQKFFYAQLMSDASLDVRVKRLQQQDMSTESYTVVVDTIVEDFFAWFMTNHGRQIQQMEQFWFRKRKGE